MHFVRKRLSSSHDGGSGFGYQKSGLKIPRFYMGTFVGFVVCIKALRMTILSLLWIMVEAFGKIENDFQFFPLHNWWRWRALNLFNFYCYFTLASTKSCLFVFKLPWCRNWTWACMWYLVQGFFSVYGILKFFRN